MDGSQQVAVVADDHLAADFDAQGVELFGDEERIGVDALGRSGVLIRRR